MAKPLPIVKDGLLTYPQGGTSAQLEVDSADWYTWLETASSFTFRSAHGSFTVHKERAGNRRGSLYWRAYCTREGKLHRVYLGKSEELTFERLLAVATALAGQGNDGDALDAATPAAPSSRASLSQEATPTSEQAAELPPPSPRGDFSRTRAALPTYLTSLLGREQEVQAVSALLARPEVRLLTLTGTPGVGKTRLGLQVASELSYTFADGVCFVSLAPLSDPDLVLPTLTQALSLPEARGRSLLEHLQVCLHDTHLLLLLDNFEQVASAAVLLVDLLQTCPDLKALVTSRTVLHVRGEYEFQVPPLDLPDLNQFADVELLRRNAAVALFLQRAQAVKSDFQVTAANAQAIAEICVRLDGLPLAIELAAARIKLLPPHELLARLRQRLAMLTSGARDVPARQQTLRKTIDWSYDLLEEDEKTLFRRLAVFVGGCTLEAAEAVRNAKRDLGEDVLDAVARLVDKSLLRQAAEIDGEPRLLMLETIREYALERLEASGEAEAMQQQHATFFLQLAEEAFPKMNSTEQSSWLKQLEADHDNLRAAMQWLLEQEGTEQRREMALRLSVALQWFWFSRGYISEGQIFLERALGAQEGVVSPVLTKALDVAAELAFENGDLEQAEALSKKSLALHRELGDTVGIANALSNLGSCARVRCQYATARSQQEEAAVLFREVGDPWKRGRCLTELARLFMAYGEYERARALLDESLEIYRTLGVQARIGWVLYLQAQLCFLSGGDLATAQSLAEQSLPLIREGGHTWHSIGPLELLGQIFLQQGETARAGELCEESLATVKELGEKHIHRDMLLLSLARVVARQGDLAAAEQLYRKSLALARAMGTNECIAFCLEGLAAVVAAQGELSWAARLWGTAEARREALGTPLPPVYRADYERAVAAVRTQLGEKFFAAAWAEGRAMSLEQVLANLQAMPSPSPMLTAPPSTAKAFAPLLHARLTPREMDVLRLLAQGLTSAQIAERLIISLVTVNSHVRSIYSKLGVTSRAAATWYALEHHLL